MEEPNKTVLPRPHYQTQAEAYMRLALMEAQHAPQQDIPIGAVVVDKDGVVIGKGVNRREADQDPLAHAEMLAIKEAVGKRYDGWRLTDCTLISTVEPCTMCAGAAVGARIGKIVFGAYEPKTGACGSIFDVVRDPAVLHRAEVIGGVLEQECGQLVTEFFACLRT
ncbi:nucleoside deaminase [Corynebacterium sp. HS2168-gen11]|uniref:nucleoside deaminase n=1 Tax=Corynebacterium sp. HS2168-gen11 TaxID=2974027 RepID=UPI00216B5DDB|nr:nucleoside deaminase [Corynebacterium sp. HS2168-gen11]MCS4535557.1 nucleoside deaminase [Corynebacterium sp. HS2168-gen11]